MFYKRKIADLAFQDRTNITSTDYTRFETPMPRRLARSGRRRRAESGRHGAGLQPESGQAGRLQHRRCRSQRYDQRHALHRFRGIVQCEAPGRRDAVRQLDRWTTRCSGGATTTTTRTARRRPDSSTRPPPRRAWMRRWAAATAIRRQFDYPFIHEFKFAGNYSFPYGLDLGAVLQSYGGQERIISWAPEQRGSRTASARRPRRSS